MTLQPITRLRQDLAQIQKILLEARLLPFAMETQLTLLASAQQLEHHLERLTQSHLTVGLLGGTGVGKSSLMNALAGSSIASTDHRRPHTDRVLIYHHAGQPIPAAVTQSQLSWQALAHDAEGIRHIVLCDLPDFDSLIAKNRELVLDFLEHLDVLIWVSSPEKYADASFYDFLALVPKAREHFVFVLNKADLLFADVDSQERATAEPSFCGEASPAGGVPAATGAINPASGYVSLEKLLNRFQEHIGRYSIEHPLIYAVSAQQVVAGQVAASWNQFAAFRNFLFQQRDVKEVVAIRAANLDEEIQRLVDTVRSELVTLTHAVQALQQLIETLTEDADQWISAGRLALEQWIEGEVQRRLERFRTAPSWLVGPGRLLASLHNEWQLRLRATERSERAPTGPAGTAGPFPEALTNRLHGQLEHIEHRLANALMRQALPAGLSDRLLQAMDLESGWEKFIARVDNAVESRLVQPAEPQRSGALIVFRSRQMFAYGALIALFLVAVGGEGNWTRLFQHPSWSGLAGVALSIGSSLFSPSGLAALGSLGVLSLLLAWRFFRRYKKLLQQQNRTIIDALKNEIGNHWENVIRRVIGALVEQQRQMEQPVAAVSQLRREFLGE